MQQTLLLARRLHISRRNSATHRRRLRQRRPGRPHRSTGSSPRHRRQTARIPARRRLGLADCPRTNSRRGRRRCPLGRVHTAAGNPLDHPTSCAADACETKTLVGRGPSWSRPLLPPTPVASLPASRRRPEPRARSLRRERSGPGMGIIPSTVDPGGAKPEPGPGSRSYVQRGAPPGPGARTRLYEGVGRRRTGWKGGRFRRYKRLFVAWRAPYAMPSITSRGPGCSRITHGTTAWGGLSI